MVAKAKAFSLNKLADSLKVGLVRTAVKFLPARLVSGFSRFSSVTGLKGARMPKRSAALYGMMAALPNRGDLDEIVLDLLDQFTQVEESPGTL